VWHSVLSCRLVTRLSERFKNQFGKVCELRGIMGERVLGEELKQICERQRLQEREGEEETERQAGSERQKATLTWKCFVKSELVK